MDALRFITLLYIVFATFMVVLCFNPKNYMYLSNIRYSLVILGLILFLFNAFYSETGFLDTILIVMYLLIFMFAYVLFHESVHALMIYLLTGKLPKYIYIVTNRLILEGGYVFAPKTTVYNRILITSMPLLLTSIYILILLVVDRYYTIVAMILFMLCVLNSIIPGSDFFYVFVYSILGNVLAMKISLIYMVVMTINAYILFSEEHKKVMEYSPAVICLIILFYIVSLI